MNPNKKTENKLSTWLLKRPIQFMAIAFALTLVITVGYSLIAWGIGIEAPSRPLVSTLIILGFAVAAWYTAKKLPGDKMDRRSFVALNNAQTLILSGAFIILAIILGVYGQKLLLKLMLIQTFSVTGFFAIAIGAVLISLYLLGIFIFNVYAKFRRIREMGVSTWRTVFTMPFGFSLLWIPGYLLPDSSNKNTSLKLNSRWYNKLTDRIIHNPTVAALSFVVITLLSGFFFGFNLVMLAMIMALVFAFWARIRGIDAFRREMPNKYSVFAIVVNIIAICTFIALITVDPAPHPQNVTVNINDTETITQTQQ